MKKVLAASAIVTVMFTSCLKDDTCNFVDSTIVAPSTEIAALKDSLDAHGIVAILHPSGFYYTIVSPGTGSSVTNLCSEVTTMYKGGFFNGNIFDSTATGEAATFQLGQVIPGWQKGIALVKGGGDINLYIPPSLGYGSQVVKDQNTGQVIIPANSYLVFEVKVKSIQ